MKQWKTDENPYCASFLSSKKFVKKKIGAGSPSIQSGTKPNLVAKILATNFGVFFSCDQAAL